MPPVLLFGRYWRVGSDDFVCPAVTELLVRSGWVAVFTAVIVFHLRETETLQCLGAEYNETTAYLATTLALLVISCAAVILLALHSARGTMFHNSSSGLPDPRRWVITLLYVNMGLNVIELIWTVCGTAFTINDFVQCKNEQHVRTVIIAVLVIIGLTYILLFLKLLFFVFSFRPYARVKKGEETELLQRVSDKQVRESELNYRGLRCCAPCARDEKTVQAFRDIASLLSKVMHDTELVPTDVVAGLVLLHHQHIRHSIRSVDLLIDHNNGLNSTMVDNFSVDDQTRIELDWSKIRHFYQFSSAAYGYWWYVIQSPCSHLCSLGAYLNCCPAMCCCRRHVTRDYLVLGDGLCHCNLAAIQAILDVDSQDVLVFDNRNSLEEVPFFLIADRSTQSLVISIRGTLSLVDMLTDLRGIPGTMADSSPEGIGIDVDWKGHQGMVNAASYVYKRLHGLPTNQSKKDRVSSINLMAMALSRYPGFGLVVTGHSLGAGTATILTFLLRAKYPGVDVTCYAYSPPGGLLCKPAAKESEKFTVSIVVGDDVVPRTSLSNLANLSVKVKSVCRDCSLPKYKILGYGLLAACCCVKPQDLNDEVDRMFPSASPSPRSDTDSTIGLVQPDRQDSTASISALRSFEEMYLPGRLLHCIPSDDDMFLVSEVGRAKFGEILVSPRMLADHMPNYVHMVLEQLGDNPHIMPFKE